MRRRGRHIVDTGIDDNARAQNQDQQGNEQSGDNSAHRGLPSEPGANAENEAHITRALTSLPRKIRRLPEFSLIDDPEIGGKCPAQLVTQPEARIDIGKPGADETRGVRLAVNIELDLRLQDEPLCQEKVVGGLQPGGEMSFAAYKTGDLQIEEIRGETLDAEGAQLRVECESMSLRKPPCRSK